MISIIICSKFNTLDTSLKANIQQTIGDVDYEIIHIDNSRNDYNIFQAYNLGVERAKGGILCFMHEDICYHSHDWGRRVEEHFHDEEVGAIGVAGGKYVAKELDWRFYGMHEVALMQGNSTIEQHPQYEIVYYPEGRNDGRLLTSVALLDGVWLCIRKKLFDTIRWDDQTFHDFHLYDSDICMQINSQGSNIYVCHDILIEHKSYGTFTTNYKENLDLFLHKWSDSLPLQKGINISEEDAQKVLRACQKGFEKRLADDLIKIRVIQKTRNRKELLNAEEKAFQNRHNTNFFKSIIKAKHISSSSARCHMHSFLHNSSYSLCTKISIAIKYLWYRKLFPTKQI